MKNQSKILLLTATMLALGAPMGAFANHTDSEGYHIVISGNGNAVRDSHGNCVLTKWKSAPHNCECAEKEHAAEHTIHSHHIYFAFNKARLDNHAMKIIEEVAHTMKSTSKEVRLSIIGHTDSVGSAEYNMKLSEKRASAVKHALMHAGVKEEEISIKAVGKSHLLLETGDNVKEAKNRVVEIIPHVEMPAETENKY